MGNCNSIISCFCWKFIKEVIISTFDITHVFDFPKLISELSGKLLYLSVTTSYMFFVYQLELEIFFTLYSQVAYKISKHTKFCWIY